MTTFEEIEVTCAVCGTKSKHRVLTSTCSFGSQDLDTRPAPLERYTLELKIMECPNCHYASDDIGEATPDIISYLKSEDYVSVNKNSAKTGMNSLAASYFKSALIKFEAEKNSDSALIKFLSAAWACDDRGDKVNADEFRLYASNILLSFSDELSLNEDMCACLLADIYRRRGNFDNAMKVCRENESDDDTIKKILAYQMHCAVGNDMSCHTVEEAVNYSGNIADEDLENRIGKSESVIIDKIIENSSDILENTLYNDGSEMIQESLYDIIENHDGDFMIKMGAKPVEPENPFIVYDGGEHAHFHINPKLTIILDYVHPDVREKLCNVEDVLIGEVDDKGVYIRDYLVPMIKVESMPYLPGDIVSADK